MGHSLGAHVSGIAGACVQKALGRQVDRITGLDPAGFEYNMIPTGNIISAGDAAFVDVIHTSIEHLGNDKQLGTVDFYANGGYGSAQPQCSGRNVFARLAGNRPQTGVVFSFGEDAAACQCLLATRPPAGLSKAN